MGRNAIAARTGFEGRAEVIRKHVRDGEPHRNRSGMPGELTGSRLSLYASAQPSFAGYMERSSMRFTPVLLVLVSLLSATPTFLTGCAQAPTVPVPIVNAADPEASVRFSAAPGNYEMFFRVIDTEPDKMTWNSDMTLRMLKAQPSSHWAATMKLCATSFPESQSPSACVTFLRNGNTFEISILSHGVGSGSKKIDVGVLPADSAVHVQLSVRGQATHIVVNGQEIFNRDLGARPKYLAFHCASSVCEIKQLQTSLE